MFFSVLLQQRISDLVTTDLLSEVSTFEHHAKLCLTNGTLVVSFLHLNPIFGVKNLLLVESCFCHDSPRYKLHGYTVHQQYHGCTVHQQYPTLYFPSNANFVKKSRVIKTF